LGSKNYLRYLSRSFIFSFSIIFINKQVCCLLSRKRFFGVFQLSETVGRTVNIAELVYIVIFIAICLIVAIFQVNINDIISINGAVIGFLFIYFMPALLHVKCLYFSHGKRFYVIPI